MPFKKLAVLLVALVWLVSFGAATNTHLHSTASAQDDGLSIVATTTVIADVLQNVAGDAAHVTSLMGPGQDPHTYQPSGNDIILLDDADLVFVNGANYEEGLLSVIEEAASDNIVEISACVEILAFGGHDEDDDEEEHTDEDDDHDEEMATADSDFAAICDAHHAELERIIGTEESENEGQDHGEETLGPLYTLECAEDHEDEAETEGEEDHAHEEGSCDPHTWGDIHNVMLWTLLARDTLSELDPANASVYATNAAAYLDALHALDEELEALTKTVPVENRLLITNHDTLSYFAHRYDFEVIGTVIPAVTTAAEPTAADVVALIEVIGDSGVPAIFTEDVVGDDVAQQIADETGASVYRLYSEALTPSGGDAPTYIDFMRYNVTTIVIALTQ